VILELIDTGIHKHFSNYAREGFRLLAIYLGGATLEGRIMRGKNSNKFLII
jgi:hypothetical protein